MVLGGTWCQTIWQNSVIFWDCLRRPQPDVVPPRRLSRLLRSQQSLCCKPWATGELRTAPPDHLKTRRADKIRSSVHDILHSTFFFTLYKHFLKLHET